MVRGPIQNRFEPGAKVVRRLWTAFAAAWLLVLVITMGLLLREPIPLARVAMTLTDLAALAGLYLRLTLTSGPEGVRVAGAPGRDISLRGRVVSVAAMAALVVPLVFLVPSGGMWWLVMYAVVAAGLTLPLPMAAAVIGGLVVCSMLAAWLVAGAVELRLLIQLAIGAAAMAVRQLTVTVRELHEAREELATRAADQERLRIARDLHDLLGHGLSLIVLKSQLAGRLLERAPGAAANEVREIEGAARDALQQVRAAVQGYRQPTLQRELAAARELLAASGMRGVVEDAAGPLPLSTEHLLAWTIREAVTNVIRHSRAHTCVIRIWRQEDGAVVMVSDDGNGVPAAEFIPGNGLAGLAERAAAHGARLTSGPGAERGFAVTLSVPIVAGSGAGR